MKQWIEKNGDHAIYLIWWLYKNDNTSNVNAVFEEKITFNMHSVQINCTFYSNELYCYSEFNLVVLTKREKNREIQPKENLHLIRKIKMKRIRRHTYNTTHNFVAISCITITFYHRFR